MLVRIQRQACPSKSAQACACTKTFYLPKRPVKRFVSEPPEWRGSWMLNLDGLCLCLRGWSPSRWRPQELFPETAFREGAGVRRWRG